MNSQQHHDEQRQGPSAMRGEWFAQQLGPGWTSSGDGIYRYTTTAPWEYGLSLAGSLKSEYADERT